MIQCAESYVIFSGSWLTILSRFYTFKKISSNVSHLCPLGGKLAINQRKSPQRAAIPWYSIASDRPLGTPNVSATVPQKWVNGDLRIFHQNLARLSLFCKNILPRCAVRLRQVGEWGNRQIFGKSWGNFSISQKIRGRGDESNHGILTIHHTPNSSLHTHELVLGSNG